MDGSYILPLWLHSCVSLRTSLRIVYLAPLDFCQCLKRSAHSTLTHSEYVLSIATRAIILKLKSYHARPLFRPLMASQVTHQSKQFPTRVCLNSPQGSNQSSPHYPMSQCLTSFLTGFTVATLTFTQIFFQAYTHPGSLH